MATGVTLEFEHLKALQSIARAVDVLDSPEAMLRDMGEYLMVAHTRRHREEVAPDGSPWAPLSPAYKKVKPKNANRILFLNGYLINTMRYQVDAAGLNFGSDRDTARWQHFGTDPYTIKPKNKEALAWPGGPGPRGKVNHPGLTARPLIGTSEDDDRELESIALRHTLNALRRR